MKKQRKNTISREEAEKDMPREAKQEHPTKRPGDFEKKPRPSRKQKRDLDNRKKSYSRSNNRTENERPQRNSGKEYFKEFYKENSKKRKEDFKVKKDQGTSKKTRRNTVDEQNFPEMKDRRPRKNYEKREGRSEHKPRRGFEKSESVERRPYNKVRKLGPDKSEQRARKPKWTKEQKLARDIKLGIHQPEEKELVEEKMPLNKYISRAGVCSRREAAELIKAGEIKVNGIVKKEPGYKVIDGDVITYQDNDLAKQEKMVYFLLNKAKDYITTTDDPEGRKTVMDLFTDVKERIFPVGRLDRNTTGLLLLTNDGQLAQKLSHPKFNNKKVYQVKLDKALEEDHFEKIQKGLELEDGKAAVDSLAYINPESKNEIGIEIHIGKNRIVRRIFEHLGYEVKHLDRVMYAGLTKKNLPRGKWRALSDKEIIFLKHFK